MGGTQIIILAVLIDLCCYHVDFKEILYLTELNLLSSSLSSGISISLSLLQESFGDKNVISSRDVAILLEKKRRKNKVNGKYPITRIIIICFLTQAKAILWMTSNEFDNVQAFDNERK